MCRTVLFSGLVYFLSWTSFAQVPAGAAAYWPFDGNAQDLSGNNSHGTVTAAVPAPNRFGQPNKAYRFNGINSHIDVANNSFVDVAPNTDFSISYWQKVYNGSPNSVIITKHDWGGWSGYNFISGNTTNAGYCNTPGHMYWYVAAGAQQDACSDWAVAADTNWHCIVGIYNAATNQSMLYIDGSLQSDIGAASGNISTTSNLNFGYEDDNNCCFFDGVLDQVRIYKRVLTTAEIGQLCSESDCAEPSAPVNASASKALSICKNSSTVLTATGTGTLNWYSSPSSTSAIAIGNSYTTPVLQPGIYTYYVSSFSCTSSQKTAITVTVNSCTGITGPGMIENLITIYPNPSSGVVKIKIPGLDASSELILTDEIGTLIKEILLHAEEFETNLNIENGIYFLHIIHDNLFIGSKKIVIAPEQPAQ